MKTGSAFLAIYSGYPKERIEYILQDSNSKILVTEDYFDNLKLDFNKLYLTNLKDFKENFVFPKVDPDDNAYIIYTSGSTGKPKGTVQSLSLIHI